AWSSSTTPRNTPRSRPFTGNSRPKRDSAGPSSTRPRPTPRRLMSVPVPLPDDDDLDDGADGEAELLPAKVFEFVISRKAHGSRLDAHLASLLPDLSRSLLQKSIDA